MPVSHDARLVFVHIQKTGGMSVVQALRDAGVQFEFAAGPLKDRLAGRSDAEVILDMLRSRSPARTENVAQDHLPAAVLRHFLEERWNRYYRFSFVRNPWDRAVSLYIYLRHLLSQPANAGQTSDFHNLVRRSETFEAFVRSRPALSAQAGFLCDDAGNQLVDFVGRFERIESDFSKVCRRVGISATLGHINASERTAYVDYYTPETRKIVAELCAEDIERFQYRFED